MNNIWTICPQAENKENSKQIFNSSLWVSGGISNNSETLCKYRHILFYWGSQKLHFYKLKVWQPYVKQVYHVFPTALSHFASLMFAIVIIFQPFLIIFVTMICDQWLQLPESSNDGSHFLAMKYFKLRYAHFFLDNATAHLTDYSRVQT